MLHTDKQINAGKNIYLLAEVNNNNSNNNNKNNNNNIKNNNNNNNNEYKMTKEKLQGKIT